MRTRLKTGLWVRALLRRFSQECTDAVLLKKGDEDAGSVLVVLATTQGDYAVLREQAGQTKYWQRHDFKTNSPSYADVLAYLERQKHYDPDLWIIELTFSVPALQKPETTRLTNKRDCGSAPHNNRNGTQNNIPGRIEERLGSRYADATEEEQGSCSFL